MAQVRQQLEALAQLPSAIQQTLSAVTQQLTEIALAKNVQEQVRFIRLGIKHKMYR